MNRPASARISGCHWTPRQNRSPGASIASTVPTTEKADPTDPGHVPAPFAGAVTISPPDTVRKPSGSNR